MRTMLLMTMMASIVAWCVTPACAQPPKQGAGQGMFKKADVNADGKLSLEEMKALRPEMTSDKFAKADKDGDGFLAPIECRKAAGPAIAGLLRKADTNGDKRVTEEELKVVMPKLTPERFAKMDRNHDGVITKEDMPPAGTAHGKPGQSGRLAALAKEADANSDGKVTLDELKAKDPNVTPEIFAKLDKNKDGVLSPEDRPQGGPQGDARGKLPAIVKESDANGDGQVTYDEIKTKLPDMLKERFEKLDHNNDGVLSEADRGAVE